MRIYSAVSGLKLLVFDMDMNSLLPTFYSRFEFSCIHALNFVLTLQANTATYLDFSPASIPCLLFLFDLSCHHSPYTELQLLSNDLKLGTYPLVRDLSPLDKYLFCLVYALINVEI